LEYLSSLWPMLLCPLLMGPMMWLAMRMNRSQETPTDADLSGSGLATPIVGDAAVDGRLAVLRAELEDIGAQQAAIAAQIERLSVEDPACQPADPNPTESIARTS
jgi:hypothetical protein